MAKKKSAGGVKEPTQQLGARIPVAIYKRLGHYALDHSLDQKDVVAAALDEYLKKHGA